MSVTKEMTVQELRDMIAPAEGMERRTIDPRTGEHRFVMAEDGQVKFTTPDRSVAEGYSLTLEAYIRLGQMLGIPGAYTRKTPHAIMMPHMNYWLVNKGLSQLTFAAEAGTIGVFSNGAQEPVPNGLILDAMGEVFGQSLKVHHVSHDLFRTVFSVVTEENDVEVAVGDVVRTGVTVENSYAMARPLTLAVYTHRLVCTNGAISVDNAFRFTRRGGGDDGDETQTWVYDAVRSAHAQGEVEVQRLRNMREVQFNDHLSESLVSIFGEFSVPQRVRDTLTDMVMDRQVTNLYDLYNTVTHLASNSEEVLEDSELSHRLMRIGGSMAVHQEICPTCRRVVT